MALARSTESPSTRREQREGRVYSDGRLWKFSSDRFNSLSKAGGKMAHWVRMEEEREISWEKRQHETALPWQKEEFPTC